EVDGVDLLVRDEVLDLDRAPAALGLRRLEVLVGHGDELALAELEGAHDLLVRHGLRLGLADLLVADPAPVLLVDEVEVERVLLDGRVHAHRHVDESEADRAGPDRAGRHGARLPGSAGVDTRYRSRRRSAGRSVFLPSSSAGGITSRTRR